MTRPLVSALFAAAVLLIAGPTSAQQPVPARATSGFEVGLRVGYGVPSGKAGAPDLANAAVIDNDVSSLIKGQIPVGVDFGYRINPNLYLGLSFMYGFGLVGSSVGPCNDPGVSCSASDINLGLEAQFHLVPTARVDPWIGVGLGYEWLDLSTSTSSQTPASVQTTSVTTSGLQFIKLELGGDVRVGSSVSAGPFVSVSAGRYSSISETNTGSTTVSRDIASESVHEWVIFGVRGIYDIRL